MANDDLFQRQKKILVPFLDRAQEIEAIAPKVSYYCRLFALEEAVKLGENNLDPRVKGVIEAVADKLADSAPTLDLDRQRDALECDKFAKMVFARADKMERIDQSDKSLLSAAQTFKYAEQYFRMTMQFGSLSEESERLRKYALWRSLELLKAHKEMRPPVAPPEISTDAAAMAELEALISGPRENEDGIPDAPSSVPWHPHPPVTAPSPEDDLPSVPVDRDERQARVNIPSSTRDFVVGQEVQYCPDGTANGQILRATVTAVTKAPGVVPQVQGPHSLTKPGGNTFEIALHDDSQARLVVADESLAPCIDAGTSMLLFGTGKPEPEVVRIEEVCASSWPPKYLVKRPDGGVAEVEDYELAPVNAINVPPTADSSEDGKVSGVASETRAGASQKGVIWSLVNYDDGEEEEGEGEEEKAEVRKVHDQEHGAKDDATLRGTLGRVSLVQGAVPSVHTAEPLVPPSIAKNDESYPASYVNEEARAFASAPPEPVVVLPTVARGSQAARIDSRTTARENSYSVPLNVVVEAQKATKSASSALSFDDVDTAVKYLRRALQLLTSSSPE